MANFTQSVREIIQQHADGQDLSTIEGIYEVGAPIFFGSEMNVISNEFRERFEKGFLLKFFNDELGYETFPLWRIAFQEKIFNNAEYINLIYDTLDKQIFADYKVRKKNTEEASRLVTDVNGRSVNTTDGNVVNTNAGTTNETNSNTNVLGEQTHDSSANTVEGKGSIVDSKTGTEKLTGTGAVVNQRSGSDIDSTTGTDKSTREGNRIGNRSIMENTEIMGSETDTANRSLADNMSKTGYDLRDVNDDGSSHRDGSMSLIRGGQDTINDTLTRSGKEKNKMNYNSASEQKGEMKDSRTQTGAIKDNSFNVAYDTPMGELSNMREGPGAEYIQAHEAGPSSGQGSDLISNAAFKYMSAASEQGATRAFDNYKDENKKSFTGYKQERSGYDEQERSFENREDEDTRTTLYGSNQSQGQSEDMSTDRHTTDQMNYNSQATTTRSGKDVMVHEFNNRHNARQTDGNDQQTYGEHDVNERDMQREMTYGSNTTEERNLQDEKSYDTDITRERDTLDITNSNSVGNRDVTQTDNGNRNVQDNSTSVTDTDTTVTDENTSNTDQTGAKSNVEDEVDYNVNLEMLYRSMPLLNKVWDIFEDLFMFIYS